MQNLFHFKLIYISVIVLLSFIIFIVILFYIVNLIN